MQDAQPSRFLNLTLTRITIVRQAKDVGTSTHMNEPEWKTKHFLKIMTHYPVELANLQQQMGLRFANLELVEVCATTIASLSGGVVEVGLGALKSVRPPGSEGGDSGLKALHPQQGGSEACF